MNLTLSQILVHTVRFLSYFYRHFILMAFVFAILWINVWEKMTSEDHISVNIMYYH